MNEILRNPSDGKKRRQQSSPPQPRPVLKNPDLRSRDDCAEYRRPTIAITDDGETKIEFKKCLKETYIFDTPLLAKGLVQCVYIIPRFKATALQLAKEL